MPFSETDMKRNYFVVSSEESPGRNPTTHSFHVKRETCFSPFKIDISLSKAKLLTPSCCSGAAQWQIDQLERLCEYMNAQQRALGQCTLSPKNDIHKKQIQPTAIVLPALHVAWQKQERGGWGGGWV